MLFCLLKYSVKLNNCQIFLLKTISGMFPFISPNSTRCIEAKMQSYFSISAVRVENRKCSWSGYSLNISLLTPLFFISLSTSPLDSNLKLVLLSFPYSSACRRKCHSYLYLVICLGSSLYVFFSITWVLEGTLFLLAHIRENLIKDRYVMTLLEMLNMVKLRFVSMLLLLLFIWQGYI